VGHLGCFHSLAIVNSAAVNIGVQCLYCVLTYIPLGMCPEAVSLDHMEGLFFVFLRNLHTAFHNGYSNLHTPIVYKSSCLATFLPKFLVVFVLKDSHSNWGEMNANFDLHFFKSREVEHFFMHLLAICNTFFENSPFNFFIGLLIIWGLNFLSFL
jgi:hypothetical protein